MPFHHHCLSKTLIMAEKTTKENPEAQGLDEKWESKVPCIFSWG